MAAESGLAGKMPQEFGGRGIPREMEVVGRDCVDQFLHRRQQQVDDGGSYQGIEVTGRSRSIASAGAARPPVFQDCRRKKTPARGLEPLCAMPISPGQGVPYIRKPSLEGRDTSRSSFSRADAVLPTGTAG